MGGDEGKENSQNAPDSEEEEYPHTDHHMNLFSEYLNYQNIYQQFQSLCLLKSDDVAIFGSLYDNEYEEDEPSEITYIELQLLCDNLYNQLRYRYGLQSGNHNILIICHGYVICEIIACLVCIKLNCPFIPIDIFWLHQGNRLNDILVDCKPSVAIVVGDNDANETVQILGNYGLHKCVLLQPDGNIVYDESWSSLLVDSSSNESVELDPIDAPLYILYTSGSTGQPKGVLGTHYGLLNRIKWQSERFPWRNCRSDILEDDDFDEDIVCRRTPLVFVDSLSEIFASLLSGTKIWVPPRDISNSDQSSPAPRSSNRSLVGISAKCSTALVSHITLLPSQLSQLLSILNSDSDMKSLWPSLRLVFVSGEACSWRTIELFSKCLQSGIIPNATLVNLYGSTEIAGDVAATRLCWKNCNNDEVEFCPTLPQDFSVSNKVTNYFVPIGHEVIDGNFLYVVRVDESPLSLVQEGEEGELLVGGKHVALGYLNNPDSPRFLKNPFHICDNHVDDECLCCKYPVLFRTGDIVKIHVIDTTSTFSFPIVGSSCFLEFIGRNDLQVKVNGGVRIHLEEAERCLSRYFQKVNYEPNIMSPLPIFVSLKFPDMEENILVLMLHVDLLAAANIPIEYYSPLLLNGSGSRSSFIRLTASIRDYLSGGSDLDPVPSFYLPSLVIPIDSIPLTPTTGKLNRQFLIQQASKIVQQIHSSDSNLSQPVLVFQDNISPIIACLIELYRGILPFDPEEYLKNCNQNDSPSSPHTSFSALGGDSMSSIEILWHLKKKYPMADISRDQLMTLSIYELACVIQNGEREHDRLKRAAPEMDTPQSKKARVESPATSRVINREICIRSDVDSTYLWKGRGISGSAPKVVHLLPSSPQIPSLSLNWSWRLSRCIDAPPLFVTSTLHSHCYVGSHGGDIAGIDLSSQCSQRLIWSTCLGSNHHIESGIICDPLSKLISRDSMENDKPTLERYPLYVSSYLGIDRDEQFRDEDGDGSLDDGVSRGRVWCLDSYDGEIIWHTGSLIHDEVKGSPSILWTKTGFPLVVVGSYGGIVYVLDAQNGQCHATFDGSNYGSIFASVLCDCDSSLLCPCLYVVTTKGHLYALNVNEFYSSCQQFPEITLSLHWKTTSVELSPVFGTPALTTITDSGRVLIFGTVGGVIECVSVKDGSSIWRYSAIPHQLLRSPFFSSPCLLEDSIHSRKTVMIGSHDGWVRFLNVDTGTLYSEVDVGAVVYGSMTWLKYGNTDMAIACTTAGEACLLECSIAPEDSPESLSWVLRSKLTLKGEIYSSPTIVITSELTGFVIGCRDDCVHYISLIN